MLSMLNKANNDTNQYHNNRDNDDDRNIGTNEDITIDTNYTHIDSIEDCDNRNTDNNDK